MNSSATAYPDDAAHSYAFAAAAALAAGLLCAAYVLHSTRLGHTKQEPPVVPYSLPLIGNTLAFGKNIGAFYAHARKLFGPQKPYTFFVALQRFYIATDPYHVKHIFRRPKSLSFIIGILDMMEPLFGVSKDGMDLMRSEAADENSYANRVSRKTRDWIVEHSGDGVNLGDLEKAYHTYLAQILSDFKAGDENLSLVGFTCDVICKASVPLFYGDSAMHNDPGFADYIFTWLCGMQSLMSGLPQRFFARAAYNARAQAQSSTARVLQQPERFEGVCDIIKWRIAEAQRMGLSLKTAGQIELGLQLGVLGNSMPSCFWMYINATASADLEELRAEIAAAVSRSSSSEGEEQEDAYVVSSKHLMTACPLLQSYWNETLRFYQNSAQIRRVLEDTEIPAARGSDDKLVFRKGGLIQISLRINHTEPAIWGADAHTFDGRRFLPERRQSQADNNKQTEKTLQDNFNPFGGGMHLCPGRHFAAVEIVTYVATMLHFFDLDLRSQPVPPPELKVASFGVAHPVNDVTVGIARRKGFENARWTYI